MAQYDTQLIPNPFFFINRNTMDNDFQNTRLYDTNALSVTTITVRVSSSGGVTGNYQSMTLSRPDNHRRNRQTVTRTLLTSGLHSHYAFHPFLKFIFISLDYYVMSISTCLSAYPFLSFSDYGFWFLYQNYKLQQLIQVYLIV